MPPLPPPAHPPSPSPAQATGDRQGACYYLGTDGRSKKHANPHVSGAVKVMTSGGMLAGAAKDLVSRKRAAVCTADEVDSWVGIDFGEGKCLNPSHVTLLNGSPVPGCDVVNLAVEGFGADRWVALLGGGGSDRLLKSPHGVRTFALEADGAGFRYLRVRMVGRNSAGTFSLPLAAFEWYGVLRRDAARGV